MAGHDDRPPPVPGIAHQLVDQVTTLGVETGVGLVQQPQLGVAGHQPGQGAATPLTGAEPGHRDVAQAPGQAEPLEGRLDRTGGATASAYGEADVVEDRQVVIEGGCVADETEMAANRPPVDPQIMPEDDGRAFDDWYQSGAGAQQGGFPGTVWPRQEHDLADPHVEVDAREGWEASEQADGGAEVDSEGHAGPPRLPVPPPVLPRRPDPRRRRVDVPAILSFTGRMLIMLGLLILGFVGFELLGTNVAEARNQSTLKDQLVTPPPAADLPVSAPLVNQPAPPPPPVGSAVARLRIPRIGVDKAVVEGVDLSDLRKGPGHYANTPLPGQPGNAAIAGHRTTYGAPFYRLDEMKPGDPILVSTMQGAFRYEVSKVVVVKPSQVEVLETTAGNQLTLTTCNPRFSAAQRLVVVADLKGPAAVASPPAPTAVSYTHLTLPTKRIV